jgi:3-oxoacid CoA-transferase subunit B
MDLVASAKRIVVAMQHVNKAGESKLLAACTLPLTGVGCVTRVVTELAVIDVTPLGFVLVERAPGVPVGAVVQATAARLRVPDRVPEMRLG